MQPTAHLTAPAPGTAEFRTKVIDLFRIVVILCMITTHIPWRAGEADNRQVTDVASFVVLWLQDGLGRTSSAALTVISGWFLYFAFQRYGPWATAQKRALSIGLPYIFWCLAYGIPATLVTGPVSIWKLLGIGYWPANYPLSFLFDLLVSGWAFALLWPVYKDRSWLAFPLGAVFSFISLINNHGEQFSDSVFSLYPRAMILFFMGIGISSHKLYDILFQEKYLKILCKWRMLLLSLIFTFVAMWFMLYMEWTIAERSIPILEIACLYFISYLTRMLSSIFIFSISILLMRLFSQKNIDRGLAFKIFCSHLFGLAAVSMLDLKSFIVVDWVLFAVSYLFAVGAGISAYWIIRRANAITGVSISKYI